jgi:hypothetical protein
MANVNTTQLRTILQSLPKGALVTLHASVVLSLLNQYKASAGSEVTVTAETPGANKAPVDLSAF